MTDATGNWMQELAEKEYPVSGYRDEVSYMIAEKQRAAFIRGLEWKGGDWISVEDGLPVSADANENGHVLAALRKDRQNSWLHGFGLAMWNRILKTKHTHWMKIPPLPQPPKIN